MKASDFELLEEGVSQKISYFQTPEETARTREEPGGRKLRALLPPSLRERVPAQSLDQTILNPRGDFTALLFSVLQPENRVYVRKAAIEYAARKRDDTWIGNSTSREMARGIGVAGTSRRLESDGTLMSGPMTRDILETREDLIRSDSHKGLLQLAKDTGGIFIRYTNDLTAGLERIDEDLNSYYLLGYSPTASDMDGTYRSIEVRVSGLKDADLQFRRGYYAVDRVFDEAPVLEYELPALTLLEKQPDAKELPVASRVLSFPKPDEPGLIAILADLPAGSLTYGPNPAPSLSNFTFVVVVRDREGNLERKVSQQYRLGRSADAAPPADGILFYRKMRLAPGDYTVDVVGVDALAGKGGIEHLDVQIPVPDPSLPELSSLILVESAERLNGRSDVPFQAEGLLLYPMLRDGVSHAERSQLDFFFSLYASVTEPKKAILELLHYNEVVGKQPLDLPTPEPGGRVA